jgi:long-chain acyl-CoA synthetase
MICYLPLAHIFEFVVENFSLFCGATLGYASIRTLTDASVRNCKGDIKEFCPTLMTGVPAVWESIRKGILSKLQSTTPNAQALFTKAFNTKSWLLERGLPTILLDRLVFNKIKEQLGGRLKFAISAGAPLAHETQKFLTITVCPIVGGYGM